MSKDLKKVLCYVLVFITMITFIKPESVYAFGYTTDNQTELEEGDILKSNTTYNISNFKYYDPVDNTIKNTRDITIDAIYCGAAESFTKLSDTSFELTPDDYSPMYIVTGVEVTKNADNKVILAVTLNPIDSDTIMHPVLHIGDSFEGGKTYAFFYSEVSERPAVNNKRLLMDDYLYYAQVRYEWAYGSIWPLSRGTPYFDGKIDNDEY